mgnify:CR=1 FL=1
MSNNKTYKDKLQFKINFVFGIALTFTLLAIVAIGIWLTSKELIAKDRHLIEKIGESIVLNLEKQTLFAENVVATMASLSVANRQKDTLKKQLDYQMKAMASNLAIEGGGIWPRPYTLDPDKEKASLFWLRNDDESFTFSTSYNHEGSGEYFLQEWYLPVQFNNKKGCYWSHSYTDPVSHERMVTCSESMMIDGIFQGVATVDVNLNWLQEDLQNFMQGTDGYALVLDRNDSFIASPNSDFQNNVLGLSSAPISFGKSLNQADNSSLGFRTLQKAVADYRQKSPKVDKPNIANYLAINVAGIDRPESLKITNYLFSDDTSLHTQRSEISSDPIFNEPVELVLLHMANTDWLVALIIPERLVLARAKEVSYEILLIMAIGILLGALFLSYQLHHMLVKPLRSMINKIRAHRDDEIHLDESASDELNELAQAYNTKQRALTQSNEVLLMSKRRYQSMLDTAIEGIISLDKEFKIIGANPASLELFSCTKEQLLGLSFSAMLNRQSYADFNDWIEHLEKTQSAHQELSLTDIEGDGEITIECSASHAGTLDDQFLTIFIRDISERKAAEDKLNRLATTDNLTGLANRNAFNNLLDHMMKLAQRHDKRVALLFIDLDYFKAVNDTYGHTVGDKLLCEVSQRLLAPRRQTDLVARLGGDEFAVVLSHFKHTDNVCTIAQDIINSMRVPFVIDGINCQIGASVGIAVYPDHAQDFSSLIKQADFAMYQAKDAGRNSWRFFTNEQQQEQQRLQQLTEELAIAIHDDQLVLYFQPIKDCNSNHVMRCESLVRWIHPESGLIPPNDFIHVAESSGLITELGAWVLEEACRTLSSWDSQGISIQHISVNISAIQLQRTDLVSFTKKLLQQYNLAGQRLIFEITETLLLDKKCASVLREINALGIQLAIDDFGTGYSSLSYLQEYPIDILKIDRSFVWKLEHSSELPMCKAIITLAHSLNLSVIAEGVETQQQLDTLQALDCNAIQGYLLSRPLPEFDFLEWLAKNNK